MNNPKTQYMRVKTPKKDYNETLWTAEANVDFGIVSTRPTVTVVREEVINGKTYKVISI